MQRFLAIFVASLIFMAAGSVLAQHVPIDPTLPGSQESATWYWDGAAWIAHSMLDPEDVNARLWRSGDEATGNCNKKWWTINVAVTASVAQWVDFDLDWNQFDWFVRKPGIYAGNCIEGCVASNSDILIDYEGFEDLQPILAGNNPIEVYYGFETAQMNPLDPAYPWVRSFDLNFDDDLIIDCEDLHYGICWKLWNKITVIECNSACEYRDDAEIILTLLNQKEWIDWDDGFWWDTPKP
ncbi:MAG: hypothetical protein JSV52_10735 [Candidatus Zixiibacteriota bacterium]|nr:MAG: hypothetical protein JSV52_10735 [candidate division Zixibacteria bacterium]